MGGRGGERTRLGEADRGERPWRKWGPYLSERQWGTVREDYSVSGDAWEYFPHDDARSRAYRWGEDGIGGFCDEQQRLCFSLALWNGRDPIIKERLFGLTNKEGNHGEDVKEYYYYLDSTPTHSYMKFLYKYPQKAYPYDDLVATNKRRTRAEPEYELLDTGVFDDDAYFDVFVEYAKADPDDIIIKISCHNRGSEAAALHLLPTLLFRNTWSQGETERPLIRQGSHAVLTALEASHPTLGDYTLYCEGAPPLLFCDNETNQARLYGKPNATAYVKDGINDYLLQGMSDAINPAKRGTKASVHYLWNIAGGGSATALLRLRGSGQRPSADMALDGFLREGEAVISRRLEEADDYYRALLPAGIDEERRLIMRQALSGMFWSKQYYLFDLEHWLKEHGHDPFKAKDDRQRNAAWYHMVNDDIISMPDKWEYPWYAAWDLAFHGLVFAFADVEFAKKQLDLMFSERYLHPSGQMPAYEWNFSDVNPPVHAWATLFLYNAEKLQHGKGDLEFLKRNFGKLMLNFTWWINRKDRFGKNVFEGGFLGLDNIGVFDRSRPMPWGGSLEQSDSTAWMLLFCLNMIEIATELAAYDSVYDDLAVKFVDHYLFIAAAANRVGGEGLWNEEDGFYYDIIRHADGTALPLRVRSMVGLLPLCSVVCVEEERIHHIPRIAGQFDLRLRKMPELRDRIHPLVKGEHGRTLLSLVNRRQLESLLSYLVDEAEFLSPYGIRALSKYHSDNPYVFRQDGQEYRVEYEAAESRSGMFGGNSNWRGPIWFPLNALIVRALIQYYLYYGDELRVECPKGSGKMLNLYEVSMEIVQRLTGIFLRDGAGRRPVFGGYEKMQSDPHWRDCLLFHEYFNGDSGQGLGASHQTGWTGLIGSFLRLFNILDAEELLRRGRQFDLFSKR